MRHQALFLLIVAGMLMFEAGRYRMQTAYRDPDCFDLTWYVTFSSMLEIKKSVFNEVARELSTFRYFLISKPNTWVGLRMIKMCSTSALSLHNNF